MNIKECPKCPHNKFLLVCGTCNGGEICIHGKLAILCLPCIEVRRYFKKS